MGNIVLLDDLTINQIAAGEVIERPANVVKELVENSIDAGAKKIIIEIKKGGKELIKITDNGSGIAKDDMLISLERHATSKIRKIEDLEETYSMGFRGEALASIVSISKLTMITKKEDEDIGRKIIGAGGEIFGMQEVSAQTGTTVIVEDLFYNVPVRYKFLKQDASEYRYIKEFAQKVALAYPEISFRLINDGKNIFQTSGNGNIKDVVYLFYGKEIQENIIDVNYDQDNIKITGVIGNTKIAVDSRKNQILYLNKRNIKDMNLTNSIDQAFSGSTGINKYGFFIINIEMPANLYDVNVHPTKSEVRFKDEEEIKRVVYNAIKTSILSEKFLGNDEDSKKKDSYVEDEYNFLTNYELPKALQKIAIDKEIQMKTVEKENKELMQVKEKEKALIEKEEALIEKEEANKSNIIKREEKRKVDYKYIGIVFRTFIIIEIKGELYLVDQHAAHERVLYEQIKRNYKDHIQNDSQMLLMPEVINLTHREMEFVQNNLQMLQKIGYDIEVFGDNAVKISGIPDIDYKEKINRRDMFLDILDEMTTNLRSPIKSIEERFIATVACKAAVKANMDLTPQEVENLLQNLLTLQNPYTCPHGRPTTIRILDKKILDKMDY